MKEKGFFSSVAGFLRKNIYYVLLFICIAAIASMIVVAVVLNNGGSTLPNDQNQGNNNNNNNEQTKEPETPTVKPMVFTLPVKTGSIGLDYSSTEFVWLSTQQRLQIHKAIDFVAPAGTNVCAVFDGKVKSIKTDIIYGTVIVISHQDGVETVYKSLDSNVKVRVGDTVKTNDIIGYVSDSMMYEVAEGPHLHFEVWKNGKIIDPYTYLQSLEK